MKHLDTITDWTIERICYELERYNGWGYRKFHKTTLTPYLWSGTTHYARGKYVADGKWDSTHVSKQTGAMALLKRLIEIDETVRPGVVVEVEAAPPSPEPTVSESFVKADEKAPVSKQTVAVGTAVAVTTVTQTAPLVVPAVPDAITQTVTQVEAWKTMGVAVWTLKAWAMAEPFLASGLAISMGGFYVWSKKQGSK